MKKTFIILYIAATACSNSTTSYSKKEAQLQGSNYDSSSLQLRNNLVDSLYKNTAIFKSLQIDTFTSTSRYDKYKNEITAKYSASVNSHRFGYILVLEDTAHIYDSQLFEPSTEFKYIKSKLLLDDSIIDISNLKY